MFSVPAIKLAASLATMVSVSKVVGDIVVNNVTISTPAQKMMVRVGSLVISSMVVEQAIKHVSDTIDTVAKGINVSVNKVDGDTPDTGEEPIDLS